MDHSNHVTNPHDQRIRFAQYAKGALLAMIMMSAPWFSQLAEAQLITNNVSLDFEVDPGEYLVNWSYAEQVTEGVSAYGTNTWIGGNWAYYSEEDVTSGTIWAAAWDGLLNLTMAHWAEVASTDDYYVHAVAMDWELAPEGYVAAGPGGTVPLPPTGQLLLVAVLGLMAVRKYRLPGEDEPTA